MGIIESWRKSPKVLGLHKTEDGFDIISFEDVHKNECRIQMTSEGYLCTGNAYTLPMEMDQEQVKWFVDILQRFANTGGISNEQN